MTTRKSPLKKIVSGCAACSEHCIHMLNAKSIGKEHLNIFITELFIEKTVSFWDSVKKFRKSYQRCSTKKLFLKILQYYRKTPWWSFFSLEAWRPSNSLKETPTQLFSCEYCKIFGNTFFYRTPLGNCFCKLNLKTFPGSD